MLGGGLLGLLADLLLKLLDLGECVLLVLDVLEVGLELLECLLGADSLEAMDLALADPDPLAAEMPAEGEPVDLD